MDKIKIVIHAFNKLLFLDFLITIPFSKTLNDA
jgi:hypothetical protein